MTDIMHASKGATAMKQLSGRLLMFMAFSLLGFSFMAAPPSSLAANDNSLFKQMDIGLLSIGGRATYTDPNDGSSRWFGGAQVRLHSSRYFAPEGSAVSIDGTDRYVWLEKIESKDQNIVDKKLQDNGHMVTAGINFHF